MKMTLIVIIALVMAGCGSSVGWQVSFGVNPITAVQNEQGLNAKELPNRKFDWTNPREGR